MRGYIRRAEFRQMIWDYTIMAQTISSSKFVLAIGYQSEMEIQYTLDVFEIYGLLN